MSHAEFWVLAQAVTTSVQGNRQTIAPPQQDGDSATARIRNFMRMNPPEFFESVIGKDLQLYLEEVKEITQIIHVSEEESVELASYRRKDIAHNWVVL